MMSDSSEDFLLPYSRPEEVLPEYRRLFIGRPDVYAVQQTDGSYRLARQPLSDSVLLAHLAGRISVGTYLITPEDEAEAKVASWSVRPRDYGAFLSTIFDEWARNDVGQVYVQIFDIALEAWIGREPSLCVFRSACGEGLALEHNGDLYSCDHYVYPEYRLGNILETPITEMVYSDFQRKFGQDKADMLPQYCRDCDYHFMCHGECPKHRFLTAPDGEPGLYYLCAGYKHFFAHIDPHMQFMANELRHERAPANLMQHLRDQEGGGRPHSSPGPNEPCPCNSGKKFKKCCGRLA